MLTTLLARTLGNRASPTADLYFRNACPDFSHHGVEQVAPTVFASRSACLVVRHALRISQLPPRRRLIYLIDDDVAAGIADRTLPYLYRQKLRMIEHRAARLLCRYAGVAVVSSESLARLFAPLMETRLLTPYWSEPFADLSHHRALAAGVGAIDIAYLGSYAHHADLRFLWPVIAEILSRDQRVRFHLASYHRVPAALSGHARVVPIRSGGWPAWRRALAGRRFHIALYPLLDTPFNRARSPNKLIEHAVLGAAPVYSATWQEAHGAAAAGAGLSLPNDPGAWIDAISGLLVNPAQTRQIAASAQALARQLNRPGPQRALWQELLDIPLAAHA